MKPYIPLTLLATSACAEVTTNQAAFMLDYPVVQRIDFAATTNIAVYPSGIADLSDALHIYTSGGLHCMPKYGMFSPTGQPLGVVCWGVQNISFVLETFNRDGTSADGSILVDPHANYGIVQSGFVGCSESPGMVHISNYHFDGFVAIKELTIHGPKQLRIAQFSVNGSQVTLRSNNMPFTQVEYAPTASGPWGWAWLSFVGETEVTIDTPSEWPHVFWRIVQ